ncbi:hypothetical protein [Streptomyces sp. NPDC005262]|uniref:hypothetical protein n=1 Tax=Streptomyces sp. NPDC005262 TaxID=3364710 RepID=UPI0036BDC5F6
MLRNSTWDAPHLGYFLGYALWNHPVPLRLSWRAGPGAQTLARGRRRLQVRSPPEIAAHSPNHVFYFDAFGRQRRMDFVAEVNNSFLVGHYTGRFHNFDGLLVPTRRRMFRRNPDNTDQRKTPQYGGTGSCPRTQCLGHFGPGRQIGQLDPVRPRRRLPFLVLHGAAS